MDSILLLLTKMIRWQKCVPKTCGDYPVNNGYARGIPAQVGQTITVVCDAGYETVPFFPPPNPVSLFSLCCAMLFDSQYASVEESMPESKYSFAAKEYADPMSLTANVHMTWYHGLLPQYGSSPTVLCQDDCTWSHSVNCELRICPVRIFDH